jgi:hypothetical protein
LKLRVERLPWAASGALFVLAGLFAISRVMRHEATITVDDGFYEFGCLIVGAALLADALDLAPMGAQEATRSRLLWLAIGCNSVAGLNVLPDPWANILRWTGAACLLMYVVRRWRRVSAPKVNGTTSEG